MHADLFLAKPHEGGFFFDSPALIEFHEMCCFRAWSIEFIPEGLPVSVKGALEWTFIDISCGQLERLS